MQNPLPILPGSYDPADRSSRSYKSYRCVGALLACLWLSGSPQAAENRLLPCGWSANGWLVLEGQMLTNRAVVLEVSSNLVAWSSTAFLDYRFLNTANYVIESTNTSFRFLDPAAPEQATRYYRFFTRPFSPADDWKNQAQFPEDAFAAQQITSGESPVRWVKFAILLDQPGRVFYQDSQKYLLHHDFATARLASFRGMDRATFDQVSLYPDRQQILLGTLLLPPSDDRREYGIQFSGREPYPRETVRRFLELVRSTVAAPADVTACYFPAYEQSEAAAMDQAWLAARGFPTSSVNRWLEGDQVYSTGWALGRLVFITANDINQAYADGRLQPQDILMTDGVPAEIPFVQGIISTLPATPNSHVAILAHAYGVPFAYPANPAEQARIRALAGQEIVFQASLQADTPRLLVQSAAGQLDDALRRELLAAKSPPHPRITPKQAYGAISASVDALTLDDVRYFGGKAANFGLLRRVIPNNSPRAIAFSFDLWDGFMGQPLNNGLTLGAAIARRLAPYSYPPNLAALQADLAAIRDLITKTADFSPAQKQAITNALPGFDPLKKIRFRSSSNAEDSQVFSAAGLYDSFSGCLADDLDADSAGPCHCDSTEPNERGVFRALRKVYASFYNDNAFLERLRHGINESTVGMGILVHRSAPDEEEMANGVATVSLEKGMFGLSALSARLVTQNGAVSVTNPEGNAKPEVVEVNDSGGVSVIQASSLVPLGSHVMEWTTDYEALGGLLFKVYAAYPAPAGNSSQTLTLDFEYKRLAPGDLSIKQVRVLAGTATNQVQTCLLGGTTTFWSYQREGSALFANHHLKGSLTLESPIRSLDRTNLNQCFYSNALFEYREETNLHTLSGTPAAWANASHYVEDDPRRGAVVHDLWTTGSGPSLRTYDLVSVLPTTVAGAPFISLAEVRRWLRVTYATPVPTLDWSGQGILATNEEVQLVMRPELSVLQPDPERVFRATNGLVFALRFLNPTNVVGPPLGVDPNLWGDYPAAISPWIQSEIRGLTSEPLRLAGYYSQSAAAGHKYRHSEFLFEPRLETTLPPAQSAELQVRDIQAIVLICDGFLDGAPSQLELKVLLMGRDGRFRSW